MRSSCYTVFMYSIMPKISRIQDITKEKNSLPFFHVPDKLRFCTLKQVELNRCAVDSDSSNYP